MQDFNDLNRKFITIIRDDFNFILKKSTKIRNRDLFSLLVRLASIFDSFIKQNNYGN